MLSPTLDMKINNTDIGLLKITYNIFFEWLINNFFCQIVWWLKFTWCLWLITYNIIFFQTPTLPITMYCLCQLSYTHENH